jgi:hypothetical protein
VVYCHGMRPFYNGGAVADRARARRRAERRVSAVAVADVTVAEMPLIDRVLRGGDAEPEPYTATVPLGALKSTTRSAPTSSRRIDMMFPTAS